MYRSANDDDGAGGRLGRLHAMHSQRYANVIMTSTGTRQVASVRQRRSFRSVNTSDALRYEPELTRHHLLSRQVLTRTCFRPMLTALGRESRFRGFRRNRLLLPANNRAALTIGLPLHRGPHPITMRW